MGHVYKQNFFSQFQQLLAVFQQLTDMTGPAGHVVVQERIAKLSASTD